MVNLKKKHVNQYLFIALGCFLSSFASTEQRTSFIKDSTLLKRYDNGHQAYLNESNNSIIKSTINNGLESFNTDTIGIVSCDHCTIIVKNEFGKVIAGCTSDICKSKSIGEICELHGVWVKKQYRNQGIGTQIINKLINYVASKKCSLIQSEIHGIKDKSKAKKFAEKVGFTSAATIPVINNIETYIMRLPLNTHIFAAPNPSKYPLHLKISSHTTSGNIINKQIDVHYKSACSVKTEDPYAIFIISDNGKIIAGAIGTIVEYKQRGKCCKTSAVWVDKQERGHGLGTKLMDELSHYATNKGCTFIQLETYEWQAKAFYDKCGFITVATTPNVQKMRGQEQYYMRKTVQK